jgi:hypothetical protein
MLGIFSCKLKIGIKRYAFIRFNKIYRNFTVDSRTKSTMENIPLCEEKKIYKETRKETKENNIKNIANKKSSESLGTFQANSDLFDGRGLYSILDFEKLESSNRSIDRLVVDDHNLIESIFKQLENAITKEEKEKLRNIMIFEFARHSLAEEIILYPLFKKYSSNSEFYYQSSINEHHS